MGVHASVWSQRVVVACNDGEQAIICTNGLDQHKQSVSNATEQNRAEKERKQCPRATTRGRLQSYIFLNDKTLLKQKKFTTDEKAGELADN